MSQVHRSTSVGRGSTDRSGNPLADEVRLAGLTWANDGVWGIGLTVFVEGEGWAPADVASTLVAVQADFDPAEAAEALDPAASYCDAAQWFVEDRRLTGQQAEVARFGIEWLEAALNIAGLPDRVSVPGTAGYELHGGGNVMITGGYIRLVEHLAAGLDIRLDEPVVSVDHGDDGCAVTTVAGVHHGDRVVVTVPLTVVQRRAIAFRPGIPDHEAAADRLAMANLEKAVFRFDRRFWPESARRMTFVSDDHRFPTWIDTTHHAGHPTLIGFYNPLATPGMLAAVARRTCRCGAGCVANDDPGGARPDRGPHDRLDQRSVGERFVQLRPDRGQRGRHGAARRTGLGFVVVRR